MQIFITALFVIVKTETIQMSFSRQMAKRTWNIHTMEYYSAMKKEPAVATYTDLNE